MEAIYDRVCLRASKITTEAYSTSFALSTRFLSPDLQGPIHAIYGFVRFADEIVDTFHRFDQRRLMQRFRMDVRDAINERISLNPVLHSFQLAYHRFGMTWDLVDTFLCSMEMDLEDIKYDRDTFERYILGSAEVVGLMCLRVFVNGDVALYEQLKPAAMKLGSAFQKVNFLRDLHSDTADLGRMYFPGLDLNHFDLDAKIRIERDIAADFAAGFEGIRQLPKGSRFGVYLAYRYYGSLLNRIRKMPPSTIMAQRVRVPDGIKYALFCSSYVRHRLNLI